MIRLFVFVGMLLFVSCHEKKTEFIQSKMNSSLFLIKNPPREDSILKRKVGAFFQKKFSDLQNHDYNIYIYRYTPETKYFLENKPDYSGGLSGNEITNYKEDYIAGFYTSKCKKDTTRKVGVFSFYKNYYQPDTIVSKCK